MSERAALSSIPRHELVATALELGIERPDSLDTEQLTDAIRRVSEGEVGDARPELNEPASRSGWFAVARHLVASVVEQGLNLPGAAKMIRVVGARATPQQRPPLPTVTLAQIYIAQGYPDRARRTLEHVLQRMPDNTKAKTLIRDLEARASESGEEADEAHGPSTELSRGTKPPPEVPAKISEVPPPSGKRSLERGIVVEATRDESMQDALVIVRDDGGATRVCWELGPTSTESASDQGLELVLRVVEAGTVGPRVVERRRQVAARSGIASVELQHGQVLRAALVASHDSPPRVLQVATDVCSDGPNVRVSWAGTAEQAALALAARTVKSLAGGATSTG